MSFGRWISLPVALFALACGGKQMPVMGQAKICAEPNDKELCTAHEEVLPHGVDAIYYSVDVNGDLEGLEFQAEFYNGNRLLSRKDKEPLKLKKSSDYALGNISYETPFPKGHYTFVARLIKQNNSQYTHEEIIRAKFDIE